MTSNLSRREFLAGLGAAGAGALVQTGNRRPERIIDVHHHVMPPFYIREHRRDQLRVGPGITTIFEWTPQVSIERMKNVSVAGYQLALAILQVKQCAESVGFQFIKKTRRSRTVRDVVKDG